MKNNKGKKKSDGVQGKAKQENNAVNVADVNEELLETVESGIYELFLWIITSH